MRRVAQCGRGWRAAASTPAHGSAWRAAKNSRGAAHVQGHGWTEGAGGEGGRWQAPAAFVQTQNSAGMPSPPQAWRLAPQNESKGTSATLFVVHTPRPPLRAHFVYCAPVFDIPTWTGTSGKPPRFGVAGSAASASARLRAKVRAGSM